MKTTTILVVSLLLLLLSCASVLAEEGGRSRRGKRRGGGFRALRAWAEVLTENDFNATLWQSLWKQPQNFFEHYAAKLSDIFEAEGAQVNFLLVGACDGTNDKTIRDLFLQHSHWRGAFVEPFQMNFDDLTAFMTEHGVVNRTHLIHGAATDQCEEAEIKMKRPTFEERNKSLPHWMRRQIGAVVPRDKLDRPATGGWTFEFVKCYTGATILQSWSNGRRLVRPHILKVDVEGHDYQVLKSFLDDSIPASSLPMLISFEAKSLRENEAALRQQLLDRGYVVSHLANDGFAMLKADRWRKRGGGGKRSSRAEGQEEGGEDSPRLRGGRKAKRSQQGQDDALAGSSLQGEGDEEGKSRPRGGGKRRKKKHSTD